MSAPRLPDPPECPPGFHRVPARCRCGAEFLALSIRPAEPGEGPRDRRCDVCVTADELRKHLADLARARVAALHRGPESDPR